MPSRVADRLRDQARWTKVQKMPLEELAMMEQFIQTESVPEDLRVWLRERNPETLRQAADDYT